MSNGWYCCTPPRSLRPNVGVEKFIFSETEKVHFYPEMRKAMKPTSIHSVPPFFGASSAQEVLERRPAGEWHSIVLT